MRPQTELIYPPPLVFGALWDALTQDSKMGLWERYSASMLGVFLQRLKPGEAGFMNVCVGGAAFSLAYYKHLQEQKDAEIQAQRDK